MTVTPELTIAICTLGRPRFLSELLQSLASEVRPGIELLVIDNDPLASARDVGHASGLDVSYRHEPRRGVSHARNLALAEAGADLVLFLDDDQLVTPGLVDALLRSWAARPPWRRLAGLRIRIEPWLEPGADERRIDPALFGRAPACEHAFVRRFEFGTGGLLVDRTALARCARDGAIFDPDFGLTGGEDTELFMRAERAGLRFGHFSAVPVRERVTAQRSGLRHLLRIQFRAGALDTKIDERHGPKKGALSFGLTGAKLGVQLVWAAVVAADGPRAALVHAQGIAYKLGRLYALIGGEVRSPRSRR